MVQKWFVGSLLGFMVACSGGDTPIEEPEAETKTEAKADAPAKQMKKLDLAELQKAAEEVALVPSPAEMQKSLKNAGLTSDLAALVDANRKIEMAVADKDNLAVRTGVILADLVLTVKTSSKESKLARLDALKAGFKGLGAGDDIQATIADLGTQITNDAINEDDLLKEMDELSGVMVSELEYEAGEWVVPLIQAGSWLEGANLVSAAIVKENKFDVAGQLLKQPRVVEYFLKYVEREGRSKAPDQVVTKLTSVLNDLKKIAEKDTMSADDVKQINSSTSDVLSML
jgi:hypothetical protein